MKSFKNYLILLLAILAVAGGLLAWQQHLQNIELSAAALGAGDRESLEKRIAELSARNTALQDQVAALQGQLDALAAQAPGQKGRARGSGAPDGNPATDAIAAPPPAAAVDNPPPPTSAQLQAKVGALYGALFAKLNLTPEQTDQLKTLLAARMQAMSDAGAALTPQDPNQRVNMAALRQSVANAEAGVNSQIEAQFGDAVYTQYQQYQQTFPQRNTVNQLGQMLNGTDDLLTDDQASQLVAILAQTEVPQGRGGSGRVIDGGINMHSRISDQTVSQAASVLSAPQLQALQALQRRMGSN